MPKPFVRVATIRADSAIVDREGRPLSFFTRWLNDQLSNVVEAVNQIAEIPTIRAELEQAIDQANAAAQAAQDAADAAQGAATGASREQALVNSYITPSSVVSANSLNVFVDPHQRVYGDASATTVNVNGATILGSGPGDTVYVSYVDPARAGGAVTYVISTTPPIQTGDTHVVGAVTIPNTGTSNGGTGPRPPGYVEP
jgi:hypothetical protein